jgi:hypothetical protein
MQKFMVGGYNSGRGCCLLHRSGVVVRVNIIGEDMRRAWHRGPVCVVAPVFVRDGVRDTVGARLYKPVLHVVQARVTCCTSIERGMRDGANDWYNG